jgi:SWI/SNF-related matrix-associated actin-dependent regulator of chromatin subfamily A-like protein 1
MKILRHPSTPGLFQIKSDYPSRALSNVAWTLPGLTKVTSCIYEGYADAMTLVVERLRAEGLKDIDAEVLRYASNVVPVMGEALTSRLRPYQGQAVSFLIARGESGALLADEMGLGKTASAISAAKILGGRLLVVCPNFVRGVWEKEIGKWWSEANGVFFPKGTKPHYIGNETSIVVIHYDILYAWAEDIKNWKPDIVCFDEGHALANEKSRQSKAAREVAKGAKYRWVLTGTPLTNRPKDLWNVADTISPGRYGDFFKYALRYAAAHKEQIVIAGIPKTIWKFDGSSNLDELHRRNAFWMLRRTKDDVGLQLPPKTRQTIWLDVKAKKALLTDVKNGRALRESLDATANAKLPQVSASVLDAVSSGAKVVAFCWRRSVAEGLVDAAREAGLAAGCIHGGVPVVRRGAITQEAADAPGGFLLAATIDSCATGVDFSWGSVADFVELTYEPHEILQCEARLHRFGVAAPVFVRFHIARGTIDEIIAEAVIAKLDVFDGAIGRSSGEALQRALGRSQEDVMKEIHDMVAGMK